MSIHLGCHKHDVDVLTEIDVVVLHHSEEEAVGQTKSCARLHGSQEARVELGLVEESEVNGSGHHRVAVLLTACTNHYSTPIHKYIALCSLNEKTVYDLL